MLYNSDIFIIDIHYYNSNILRIVDFIIDKLYFLNIIHFIKCQFNTKLILIKYKIQKQI